MTRPHRCQRTPRRPGMTQKNREPHPLFGHMVRTTWRPISKQLVLGCAATSLEMRLCSGFRL